MRKRFAFILVLGIWASACIADDSIPTGKKPFLKRLGSSMQTFFEHFGYTDTTYIEPQHYNFTVMLQNTHTYEVYRLRNKGGNTVTLAPDPTTKIGPYIGWRWVFLGYTLDVNHLGNSNRKKEFDISLYCPQIGIDLFYRKTGNDYQIRRISLGDNIDTSPLRDVKYDGVNSSIKGFNLYYIFNHQRFSYPAAFSQSTVQRKSCGSPLIGIGYTKNSLSVDWQKLNTLIGEYLGEDVLEQQASQTLQYSVVDYTDYSVSGGYAYNWVFARNWLFASSLSLALAYKRTKSDLKHEYFSLRNFSIHNFNFDSVGRFGVVWNNTKWYMGGSAILHAYNYNKTEFSTNNLFGSVNVYVGVNFGAKKQTK